MKTMKFKSVLAVLTAAAMLTVSGCEFPQMPWDNGGSGSSSDSDEDADDYIDMAEECYEDGDIEKAIKYLKKAKKAGADVDDLLEEYEAAPEEGGSSDDSNDSDDSGDPDNSENSGDSGSSGNSDNSDNNSGDSDSSGGFGGIGGGSSETTTSSGNSPAASSGRDALADTMWAGENDDEGGGFAFNADGTGLLVSTSYYDGSVDELEITWDATYDTLYLTYDGETLELPYSIFDGGQRMSFTNNYGETVTLVRVRGSLDDLRKAVGGSGSGSSTTTTSGSSPSPSASANLLDDTIWIVHDSYSAGGFIFSSDGTISILAEDYGEINELNGSWSADSQYITIYGDYGSMQYAYSISSDGTTLTLTDEDGNGMTLDLLNGSRSDLIYAIQNY